MDAYNILIGPAIVVVCALIFRNPIAFVRATRWPPLSWLSEQQHKMVYLAFATAWAVIGATMIIH